MSRCAPDFEQAHAEEDKTQRGGDEVKNPVGLPLQVEGQCGGVDSNGRQRYSKQAEIIQRIGAIGQGNEKRVVLFNLFVFP